MVTALASSTPMRLNEGAEAFMDSSRPCISFRVIPRGSPMRLARAWTTRRFELIHLAAVFRAWIVA